MHLKSKHKTTKASHRTVHFDFFTKTIEQKKVSVKTETVRSNGMVYLGAFKNLHTL